jgi:putative ABC transport system permease protein
MSPRVLVRYGVRSLLLHKLRSSLSILGVVFGVSAVVAMASVGEGARREVVAQIGALGIDSVTVRTRPPANGHRAQAGLRLRDAESVGAVVPGVVAVAPVREAALSLTGGGRAATATAVGTTPGYQEAARLTLDSGRFLSALDVEDHKRVVVLGAIVARNLFPFGGARGQSVRLGDDWFQVVGVLEERAASRSKAGPIRTRDVNQAVFVPWSALDRGADPRPDGVDELVIRVATAEAVVPAAEVVKALLERTTPDGAFDVIVPREILRQRERTQRVFNAVTGALAAISLLVGGIGIMNIMLASVAERTREVGIRRAVGASRRDIAAQFLVESSLLTATGGVLGTVLGIAGSVAIQSLAGWPTALSVEMLLTGIATATAVGLGFGFYPAWEAAHLEPMDALRRD